MSTATSVDAAVDTRSILDRHSVDTRLIVNRLSVEMYVGRELFRSLIPRRHLADTWPILRRYLTDTRHNRPTHYCRSRGLKWALIKTNTVRFPRRISSLKCLSFAGDCKNSSDKRPDLYFYMLPLDNKPLMMKWITKMQRNPNYFNVNKHVKIFSVHFKS